MLAICGWLALNCIQKVGGSIPLISTQQKSWWSAAAQSGGEELDGAGRSEARCATAGPVVNVGTAGKCAEFLRPPCDVHVWRPEARRGKFVPDKELDIICRAARMSQLAA